MHLLLRATKKQEREQASKRKEAKKQASKQAAVALVQDVSGSELAAASAGSTAGSCAPLAHLGLLTRLDMGGCRWVVGDWSGR